MSGGGSSYTSSVPYRGTWLIDCDSAQSACDTDFSASDALRRQMFSLVILSEYSE
jgi:hypothetical protein